jgi:hypothetical protein
LRLQRPLSYQIRHAAFIGDLAGCLSDRYHNATMARGATTEIWRNPYGDADEGFTNIRKKAGPGSRKTQ